MKQLFVLTNALNQLSSRYASRFSTGLRSIKRLPLWLALLSFAPTLQAHPHSWVEMKTHIEGENGMITGLSMEWSFDAMTSMYMLDGENVSPGKEVETFKNLAASVIENMMYEHYFTYFYDGEEPIKYQVAEHAKFKRDKAKMVLTFELPLSKPKSVTRGSLRMLIFDPSYFVDMSWISNGDVTLSPELARQCQLEIVEPNPTPEQMSYAMSLPVDTDPDNTLGQLFTQSVELHCAAVPVS
ncbi:DUF1007 family protein [Vibrio echinoideorum]|uniref:DUF1007 family protein n=1 Tax=Vibrio echinoideorum TaxID=2100116 RepID=UPI00354C4EAB